MRILAYSDIHHHNYNNGLDELDVVNVENKIAKFVSEYDVDIVVFAGDRFQSRNPIDYVKYMADKSILSIIELGKPVICLVGNHDRSTKSNESHHSLRSIELFGFSNVYIADSPCHIDYNINNELVRFHCIPSGHKQNPEDIKLSSHGLNICLFHDMLNGCLTTSGSTYIGDNSIVDILSTIRFDLVIGGDNHRAQLIKHKHIVGDNVVVYCGSPLQLSPTENLVPNIGDSLSGDVSGTILIADVGIAKNIISEAVSSHEDGNVRIMRLKTGAPSFLKCSIKANEVHEVLSWASDAIHTDTRIPGSIISMEVVTNNPDIPKSRRQIEDKLKQIMKCRRVTIYVVNDIEDISVDVSSKQASDRLLWSEFVTSKGYDNAAKIIEAGIEFIND